MMGRNPSGVQTTEEYNAAKAALPPSDAERIPALESEVKRLTKQRDHERRHVARLMRDLQHNRERADRAQTRVRELNTHPSPLPERDMVTVPRAEFEAYRKEAWALSRLNDAREREAFIIATGNLDRAMIAAAEKEPRT